MGTGRVDRAATAEAGKPARPVSETTDHRGKGPAMTKTRGTVTFTCESNDEAEVIRLAVTRYGRFLRSEGRDPRNFAQATADEAGFGWDAVRQAVREMHAGSVTLMSRRMAGAIADALRAGLSWPSRETVLGALERIEAAAR